MACDIAKILREHQLVAQEAAFTLWRQGVSALDIALAPCLSEVQRLDLIDAVDELVNRRNLSNRKEKIMKEKTRVDCYANGKTPSSDDCDDCKGCDSVNPDDVKEQDEEIDLGTSGIGGISNEEDLQREAADVELAKEEVGDLKAAFDEPPDQEDTRKDATNDDHSDPSEEDTARLHVALKDPHIPQEGYIADTEVDQTPEERQDDLDKCCGTDPPNDLDRERLTDVAHILNEKEKKEDSVSADYATYLVGDVLPAGLTDLERRRVENLIRNRDYYAVSYCDLRKDYDRLVLAAKAPVSVRENVYKLIDGERDYQNQKFGTIAKLNWSPNDWLTLIDRYMMDALDVIADPDAQMVEIRKIAALAVAAMEHILTPARV